MQIFIDFSPLVEDHWIPPPPTMLVVAGPWLFLGFISEYKSIYNPNLAYSASMSLSVWWVSRSTWRQPHHSRHLQSKSCESWSSSEVKSDVAHLLSQAVLGAFVNLGKEIFFFLIISSHLEFKLSLRCLWTHMLLSGLCSWVAWGVVVVITLPLLVVAKTLTSASL